MTFLFVKRIEHLLYLLNQFILYVIRYSLFNVVTTPFHAHAQRATSPANPCQSYWFLSITAPNGIFHFVNTPTRIRCSSSIAVRCLPLRGGFACLTILDMAHIKGAGIHLVAQYNRKIGARISVVYRRGCRI